MPRHLDLAALYGVNLRGAVTWAFEFEDQPWFDGFRDLATNGVDKPVLNVFRMLGMMTGNRVAVDNPAEIPLDRIVAAGVKERPDIRAIASRDARSAAVMVSNYHDSGRGRHRTGREQATSVIAVELLIRRQNPHHTAKGVCAPAYIEFRHQPCLVRGQSHD